jgi:hypothetical protein
MPHIETTHRIQNNTVTTTFAIIKGSLFCTRRCFAMSCKFFDVVWTVRIHDNIIYWWGVSMPKIGMSKANRELKARKVQMERTEL